MPDLAGQTVLITGAGAGIGRALAIGFVKSGAHLVALGRSAAGLEETRQLCTGPGTFESHVVDVRDGTALERIFRSVVNERRGVDLLLNNAAVYPRETLQEMSLSSWAEGVAINLNGVAHGCRAAIRAFPPDREAVIFNVGTFAYLGPEPASTLYCATKAAVAAFTRALAVELAATKSRLIVNEWVPSPYRTRMSANTGDDPNLAFERLLLAWRASKQRPGGRTFLNANEVLPPRSLRSRIKSMLSFHRD